jgi:hypothetical protein
VHINLAATFEIASAAKGRSFTNASDIDISDMDASDFVF